MEEIFLAAVSVVLVVFAVLFTLAPYMPPVP